MLESECVLSVWVRVKSDYVRVLVWELESECVLESECGCVCEC